MLSKPGTCSTGSSQHSLNTHDLEGYTLEGKGYFGPGELPVFDREFFTSMPNGESSQWAFETFKQKAVAAGGVVSDELLAEFKQDMIEAIRGENEDYELQS